MRFILSRLPQGYRITAPVVVSAAAVGISALYLATSLGSVGESLLQSSVDEEHADPLALLAKESGDLLETSRKRFDGRSMYTLPPPPPRKTRPVDTRPPEPPKPVDPGPPPVPRSYTGPMPSSVLGDYVVFGSLTEEDKRIKLGDTRAGITVIAINAPYSVKLGYQRGEFTVDLWQRADERKLKTDLSQWKSGSPIPAPGSSDGGKAASGAGGSGSAGATAGAGSVAGQAGDAGSRRNPNGNAVVQPNSQPDGSARPGAVTPVGNPPKDPNDLPSDAMKPVRLPSPNGTPSGGEPEPSSESEGVEYVDRSLLPATLTPEQIQMMSREQVQTAIGAINATDNLNVDDHSRARLNYERVLLRNRLNALP